MYVDGNGVVVGVTAELIAGDRSIRTDATGTVEADVTVDEPEWTDEAEGLLPIWTYRTEERPMSSIVDDTYYVASRDGMAALDRTDGIEKWTFEPEANLWLGYADEDGVYITDGEGNAFDLDTLEAYG